MVEWEYHHEIMQLEIVRLQNLVTPAIPLATPNLEYYYLMRVAVTAVEGFHGML